jgi:hypothetical protein
LNNPSVSGLISAAVCMFPSNCSSVRRMFLILLPSWSWTVVHSGNTAKYWLH